MLTKFKIPICVTQISVDFCSSYTYIHVRIDKLSSSKRLYYLHMAEASEAILKWGGPGIKKGGSTLLLAGKVYYSA